jgi:hypothetical protein
MNLGKLLGAGKSFFGGRDNAPYRENKRVYLPKFNAEKNPFLPKLAEPAPARVPESKKVSAPPPAQPEKTRGFADAKPARSTSWTAKLNPFRPPQPVRLAPQNTVQSELSLDAVKVIHNDLADADIEIVPVKSRTAALSEAPMLAPAREAWEFLGERLVKSM